MEYLEEFPCLGGVEYFLLTYWFFGLIFNHRNKRPRARVFVPYTFSLWQVIKKLFATRACHWGMMLTWLLWLGASSRTFLKVLKDWSQKVFGVSTFSANVCSESICSPYVNFALDLNLFYRWQAIMRTLRNCLRTESINTLSSLCVVMPETQRCAQRSL